MSSYAWKAPVFIISNIKKDISWTSGGVPWHCSSKKCLTLDFHFNVSYICVLTRISIFKSTCTPLTGDRSVKN